MEKFSRYSFLWLFLLSTNLLVHVTAHISLTFPPARKMDLDFLDFTGTKMPCGMPEGRFRTTLEAGSIITVTWHLALPHKGGLHVELLEKMGNTTWKLSSTPVDEMVQMFTVKLPDMPCEDCTIRLMQEIGEAPVKNYGAWSCADVRIVKPADYMEDCLWRGKPGGDNMRKCTCDWGYWGDRCQYKEECMKDADCGQMGKCIDIMGTTQPRMQCFCAAGYHGERCQWQNMAMLPTAQTLQPSTYMMKELSDRVTLHYKMVPAAKPEDNEIEFVLVVKGTSYGAIGWRPSDIDKSCRGMPTIEDGYMDPMPMKIDMTPFKLEKKETPYTPTRPFHPMACSDIIIGTARGMHSRIRDYYTRDLSSPRLDTVYGGMESITSATGWEWEGVTTIIFRRKVNTWDPTDHELKGPMHVIWSRGMDPGDSPMQKFFAQDELKYHGTGDMKQRGMTMIDFSKW